jgi:deoxyhypusine synthase
MADELIPEPLDLAKVKSIDDLLRGMAKTAFTDRQLGEVADVLEAMARDEECFVVMTLSGAMTVARQGLIVTELIDRGIVNAVVSTGALMAHGLVGPGLSEHGLSEAGQELNGMDDLMSAVLEGWDHNEVMCSYKLNHAIGAYLAKIAGGQRGILKSAHEMGVPVFVPAFTDSEMGLDTALDNRLRESTGRYKIRFDPFEDLEHFAATLLRQKKLGIVTIGDGVPRSWAQQFGPFCELRRRRLGENVPLKRYHYGLRICSAPSHDEENSWSNSVPPAEGGRFGEVYIDATVGLPLIVAAVFERLGKKADKKEDKKGKGNRAGVKQGRS